MEERAHNVAAKPLTSLLPPKSQLPLLHQVLFSQHCSAFGMQLLPQPITASFMQDQGHKVRLPVSYLLTHVCANKEEIIK